MRRVVLDVKAANVELLNEQFVAALGGAYGGMHPREELAIFVDDAVMDSEVLAVVRGHNPDDLSRSQKKLVRLEAGRALEPITDKSTLAEVRAKVQWLEEELRGLLGI